jgi:hypothetical protein
MTPVVAFYVRDSLWVACTAVMLAAFGSELIHRHHLAVRQADLTTAAGGTQITRPRHAASLTALAFAALLLQLAALSALASMARPASIFIFAGVYVIVFSWQTNRGGELEPGTRWQSPVRLSIAIAVAVGFVEASLTPYVAIPSENASRLATSVKRAAESATGGPRPSFLQVAGSLFRNVLIANPPVSFQHRSVEVGRPYSTFRALFGERDPAAGSESKSLAACRSENSQAIAISPGDSYSGVILRPEVDEHVPIVPPNPRRWAFDEKPNGQKADPVSIPFYGAYWFFKASDKSLPPGAVESRGDPASMSFKSTDFTPMSMEARQSLGSLVNLSCCVAIEVVISNGDRRPGTVGMELTLMNTTLPGRPHQSLGISRVDSTMRWFPGDERPPVTDILSFRIPARPAIQQFDELVVRFLLRSPREQWSARIGIVKFRLIPRQM